MQLPPLGAFNISILVVLRGKIGPVLRVKTRQSQLCGTLNWPLYWLLLSSVSDCWITSTWYINIPQALWNNFTLQRNVTLQGEWWENVLEAIYEGTQMWFSTLMRHRSGFFKPLELNCTLSHNIPRTFFRLCTAGLAAQEAGNLHRLIAAEMGFSIRPLHKRPAKWFSRKIHDNDMSKCVRIDIRACSDQRKHACHNKMIQSKWN